MQILEIDLPIYKCQHRGVTFYARASHSGDGRVILDVADTGDTLIRTWAELIDAVRQDSESLYDTLDEAIYNATPEIYDHE
jgi:hypothetical protein